VWLDLIAAVVTLVAALLCLPEMRTVLRNNTGIRIGGVATALMVTVLVLCAMLSAGWPADPPPESTVATNQLVVSASQVNSVGAKTGLR
jgi:hypothetical protein